MKRSPKQLRRDARGYAFGRSVISPLVAWRFAYREPKMPPLPEPFLLIPNHSTDVDFFLIMRSFPQGMDFVLGETLLRNPILRFLFTKLHNPVILHKGSSEVRASLEILARLRAGRNVCLFAEGNTCFDGITGPIPKGTGMLAQLSGVNLVTFRVQGAYLSAPRWGLGLRRGRSWGEFGAVYSAEALKGMQADELGDLLRRDLHVDALRQQALQPVAYRSRRGAEGLENVLYLCPNCQRFDSLKGRGNVLACQGCGLHMRYTAYGRLEGEGGFQSLSEWIAWQREALRQRFLSAEGVRLRNEGQVLRLIRDDHRLEQVAEGALTLDAEALCLGDQRFPIESLAGLAIYRKNRLIFSLKDGRHYEVNTKRARSALKYRDLYQMIGQRE